MSATIDPLLIPITRQHEAHIALEHENGRSPDPVQRIYAWRRNVRIGDFTAAGATSQALNLFTGLTTAALSRAGQSGDFPANVELNVLPPYLRLVTPFAGGLVSACTIELGDAGDPNGLVEARNVFTGATTGIIYGAGAEAAVRLESAYTPTITIRTTSADVSALTAGEIEIVIRYAFQLRAV
jgi:hypothetical protein